ncbi:MAG TPA: leucyl/phenylalanyl-tRNA--protein transferase [Bacteroidota bacterium]|nr:leucyl/phenylalanyl-tRNA--protein transferase [Bacteroidota bacterium]
MTRASTEVIPPELLLNAYRTGYFPMADGKEGEIFWYDPEQRGILPLGGMKISRSLRRTIAKQIYTVDQDTAFEEVMRRCAERDETWISETIIRSYVLLHELGYAHSIEVRHAGALVGGLYGVAVGAAFFGESMFSTMTDASKVALEALVRRMNERGFELLDTQYTTPHLESLGVIEIPREQYLHLLASATAKHCTFI